MRRIYITNLLFLIFGLALARGQLLVQNYNQISAFNFNGTPINGKLIYLPEKTELQDIAAAGDYIYIVNHSSNSIGKYHLDGSVANSSLITNLPHLNGIAVYGTNIYIPQYHEGVGQYTTDGGVINASLITNSGIVGWDGVAMSGTNLYITTKNAVGKYTLDGTAINAALIAGFQSAAGIAISGTNLYVADFLAGKIGEYTLDGATNNASLISGLGWPNGIAIFGDVLYVNDAKNNSVGAYSLAGVPINPLLISGLSNGTNYGIAIMPPLIIGNAFSTPTNFNFNVNAISNQAVVLECSTNLSAPIWAPIQTNIIASTNAVLTDAAWTNNAQRFYRVRAE